jgi:hypothetical protein
MLARLAAALQRGQLQGINGAQLGAALGGAGVVVNNEDCSVSITLERVPNAMYSETATDESSGDVSIRPHRCDRSQHYVHVVVFSCLISF